MALSLDRIGWRSDDGWSLIDDKGTSRKILDATPAMWKTLLQDAVQRDHEKQLGLKTGYPELRGHRVCVDLVKRVSRASRTSKEGARLLVANACNAVWSRTRAAQSGYKVDNTTCELCGKHEDTIHSRIWKCQHPDVKAAREKAASPTIIKAAVKAGPNSSLYNRGLFAHPEESYPAAAEDLKVECTMKACRVTTEDFKLEGNVYLDGSCDQHMIKDLKRASWGIAVLIEQGETVASAKGAVPSDTIQTSQSGEYGALAAAMMLVTGACHLFSDCSNVVRD